MTFFGTHLYFSKFVQSLAWPERRSWRKENVTGQRLCRSTRSPCLRQVRPHPGSRPLLQQQQQQQEALVPLSLYLMRKRRSSISRRCPHVGKRIPLQMHSPSPTHQTPPPTRKPTPMHPPSCHPGQGPLTTSSSPYFVPLLHSA